MAVEAGLPQIGTVIVTAIIDSINPCAIGVMILLVSLMIANARLRPKMLMYGGLYIFSIFLTYLLAGLGLIAFFQVIPLWVSEYIAIVVGSIIVIAGLIEVKDFFWYGQGISLSIPAERAKQIKKMLENISVWGVIFLGAFVAAVELPCTGGPYLAIILLLSQNFNFTAFLLLVFYNILFVLPLVLILLAVMLGTKVTALAKWKQASRAHMRLAIGVILIILGWLLILIANGTINLG
ncbi:GAP family protein [Candidatus Micrarchaeota archaeon]|nr:GAP family protein [Candidatus Micrarchaeota archaeon]